MGIVYNTSKWADMLWNGHVKSNPYAESTIEDGTYRQKGFDEFSKDVHTSLYQRHMPAQHETVPDWASHLLSEAEQLPEWQKLRSRCQSNGFLSGIATQKVLENLIPLLPEQQEDNNKQQGQEQQEQQGQQGQGESAQGAGMPQGTQEPTPEQEALRRKLRMACRQAEQEATEAEHAIGELAESFGIHAGDGVGKAETLEDTANLRALYAYASQSRQVKEIARLAGRMKRMVRAKKRSKVVSHCGAISGIELGQDIGRILPSELAMLQSSNQLLRLQALQKIMQGKALQYATKAPESLAQGPVVVCVDESGSMYGDNIEWARAIALALLSLAQEQKRAWHYVGFNKVITQTHTVIGGKTNIETLCGMLNYHPTGGTNFTAPLDTAADIMEQDTAFAKADILFITDGHGKLDASTIERINTLRQRGLAVYVVGIGAEFTPVILQPITTECYAVANIATSATEKAVEILTKI